MTLRWKVGGLIAIVLAAAVIAVTIIELRRLTAKVAALEPKGRNFDLLCRNIADRINVDQRTMNDETVLQARVDDWAGIQHDVGLAQLCVSPAEMPTFADCGVDWRCLNRKLDELESKMPRWP